MQEAPVSPKPRVARTPTQPSAEFFATEAPASPRSPVPGPGVALFVCIGGLVFGCLRALMAARARNVAAVPSSPPPRVHRRSISSPSKPGESLLAASHPPGVDPVGEGVGAGAAPPSATASRRHALTATRPRECECG
jgi:hypothetical protein